MKELKDTLALMNSADFKERFSAEYYQLETRYLKLIDMLKKYKNKELTFTPKCSYGLLSRQARYMKEYLKVLIKRAEIESIELEIDENIINSFNLNHK